MTSDTTPPTDPSRDPLDSGDTDKDLDVDLAGLMMLVRDPSRWPELRERLARLLRVEEALAYYADPKVWFDNRVSYDMGERARTALNQEPSDGE